MGLRGGRMTPYVSRLIPNEDVVLFEEIRDIVQALPDMELEGGPRVISCHILARALSRHFPVKYHDGYFFKGYRHSWLRTVNKNIIDPYPIALFGGPVLLHCTPPTLSPWRRLYVEARLTDLECEIYEGDVDKVSDVLGEIIQKLIIRIV